MANTNHTSPLSLSCASARIDLKNVQLQESLILDEVHLESEKVSLVSTPGTADATQTSSAQAGSTQIDAGEVHFRAILSEPNLNRYLAANMPADTPLRNITVAVLAGKLRFSGQLVKLISLPISLEAVPKAENGIRIFLDWQGVKLGIALPASAVELLEQFLNKEIDLTASPIPVWIEELRCEPGRITVIGKAKLAWPPVKMIAR